MRRVGDHYHYDQPDQEQPYHWLTYLTWLVMAAIMAFALASVLPWNPWITFWAILALCAGERILLRPRKTHRR